MMLEVARSESGPAMLSAALPLLPGDGTSRVGQAVVDTRVLPAGDYVARIGVAVSGKEVARVAGRFAVDRDGAGGEPRA